MGYYIETREIDFKIKESNEEKALQALKDMAIKNNRISWVDNQDIIDSKTFKQAFSECRYQSSLEEVDGEMYITIDYFSGEKYGSEELIFNTLAPYVEDGSYITYQGEEGEQWRYTFNNGTMKEKTAKITW